MSYRAIRIVLLFPVLLLAASLRADTQPSDDKPEAIEIDHCVRFTLPQADQPLRYSFEVDFDSKREQSVNLYVWEPASEKWEHRAFINSYYQGNSAIAHITLPPGKQVAVVGWHKEAAYPESRLRDWHQNDVNASDVTQRNPNSPLATVTCRFQDGDGGVANATLKPEPAAVR